MLPPKTKVSVFKGPDLVSEQELPPGEYVIGGGDDAQIKIGGEPLLARHAILNVRFNDWIIEDMGSAAGTFVNGERVTEPRPVFPSQTIEIADATIRLHRVRSDDPTLSIAPQTAEVRKLVPEELRGDHKYRIERVVAHGGMGIILSAYEETTRRVVAMKVMQECSAPAEIRRFVQEAQITAELEHPNIVPVHELGVNEQEQPFYTMKLVRGVSLKEVLASLALGEPEALRRYPLAALLTVFQKICDAVAFAHSKGFIHRDLKPENVMIGEYGEVLLMDWGLAKRVGEPPGQNVIDGGPEAVRRWREMTADTAAGTTMAGTVLGTPQYMSPEQARGENDRVDERSDIYALGAILYHLLVLTPPFIGKDPDEVLEDVRAGRLIPPDVAAFGKSLLHLPGERAPESLGPVAMRAMALEPARRYPKVTGLQAEIAAYQSGFATAAEQAGAWKVLSLFLLRHRTISIAAALLLLSGILFTINLARERNRATAASIAAGKARVVAEEQRNLADEQRNVAEDRLYSSHMLQAGRHVDDGRPESAWELLAQHRQEQSGRDLRSWEWYYTLGQLSQDRLRAMAHPNGVLAVAVSPDGARLATGGADGAIVIWKTAGLVQDRRLPAAPGPVLTVAWDRAARWVAAGFGDGSVSVWDASTGEKLASLQMPSGKAVRSVVWEPVETRAARLAIGGVFPEVVLWRPFEPAPASKPEEILATKAGAACLDWSQDGRLLAVGELNNPAVNLEVLDLAGRRRLLATTLGSGGDTLAVAIDPSGRFVAAGSKNRSIGVFEIAAASRIMTENPHRGFVSALSWSPDGERLASASHDGTIRLLSPFERKDSELLCGHTGEVNSIVWSRIPNPAGDGGRQSALFSGSADGTVRVWAPRATQGYALNAPDQNWIAAARWSPDGRRIALANFHSHVEILEPVSGQSVSLPSLSDDQVAIHDLAWAPSGDRIAIAIRTRGVVEVLDALSGRPLCLFELPRADRVAWSSSGRYLAGSGAKGAKVWDTRLGEQLSSIARSVGGIAWNADERRLAVGGTDGAIEIWDGLTGKMTAAWRAAPPPYAGSVPSEYEPQREVFDLAWSPSGSFLAFVTQDSLAGLLDGATGLPVRKFGGHASGIWRLAWSPDSRRLATGGQDGTLRIFNASSGDQVAHIDHGDGKGEIHSIDWSADGQRIITGGYDFTVRIWDAGRGRDVALAEDSEHRLLRSSDGLEAREGAADLFARLGWVSDARAVYASALDGNAGNSELVRKSGDAEASFRGATRRKDSLVGIPQAGVEDSVRAISALNRIQSGWEAGNPQAAEAAVAAYASLSAMPEGVASLALAQRYFSRAAWDVAWFPLPPGQDFPGPQGLPPAPDSLHAPLNLLSFPYRGRAPRELPLDPKLPAQGPKGAPFGMIARSRILLPAGRWRFQITADGAVRVRVDGAAVLDRWQPESFGLASGDCVQDRAGFVNVTVENFVSGPSAGFDLLLMPVIE